MATTAAPEQGRTQPSELHALVAAAHAAQEQWAARGAAERAQVLRETVRVILRRADEIADTVVAETAKPRTEAISNELFAAADHASWLAKNAPSLLRDEPVSFPQLHPKAKKGRLLYEPLGVVGAITPWNVPFAIPFGVVAAAVAAGNGVVLKPSELTPRAGEWVSRVLVEAGMPAGLVQLAQGERGGGEAPGAAPGGAQGFFPRPGAGRRPRAPGGRR